MRRKHVAIGRRDVLAAQRDLTPSLPQVQEGFADMLECLRYLLECFRDARELLSDRVESSLGVLPAQRDVLSTLLQLLPTHPDLAQPPRDLLWRLLRSSKGHNRFKTPATRRGEGWKGFSVYVCTRWSSIVPWVFRSRPE